MKLFRHEIKQIKEVGFVRKSPGPDATTEAIGVNGGTEVLTAWGEVHTVDEAYDAVDKKVFGGE